MVETDGRIERGRATRGALVAAATKLFGEHGYDATSIETVLHEAGVARGALYHHFDSKEALFDAVLDQEVARVAHEASRRAARAVHESSDPLEGLRVGCRTWLRVSADPAFQRILLIDAPAVVGWRRCRELDEEHTLGGLLKGIGALAAQGRVAEREVKSLAHMVQASVAETSLMIAQADDAKAGQRDGLAALDTLLVRLFGAATP